MRTNESPTAGQRHKRCVYEGQGYACTRAGSLGPRWCFPRCQLHPEETTPGGAERAGAHHSRPLRLEGGRSPGFAPGLGLAGEVDPDVMRALYRPADRGGDRGPDRLGIGGNSHGGFMAAWAIGQTSRFKAAMMAAGISDWGMLAATREWGTLDAELSGSCGWEGTGPHPHDQVSPISFTSKIRTPVLIVHGEDDTNVRAAGDLLPPRAQLVRGRARARHLPARGTRVPARGTRVRRAQPPARPAPAHARLVRPVAWC